MGMKDKHKPLTPDRLDSYRVASCAVASRTLLPSTLYLDSAHSSFRPRLVAVRIYVKKNLQSVCSRHEGVHITIVCFLAGAGLQFTFTQVHCRASCFWRKNDEDVLLFSVGDMVCLIHDWLARITLREVKWDLDTGRRELRRHQVKKNHYSHTQLPLFSYPKFRMDSITPQWPGY